MPTVSLELDLSGLQLPNVSREMLAQRLKLAGLSVGQAVQGMLVARAQDVGLRSTGSYIRGWQADGVVSLEDEGGKDRLELTVVVRNADEKAYLIEDGHEAFHLPSKIRWGQAPRVKHTKDGKPFLHIPLRHFAHASEEEIEASGLTNTAVSRMMPQNVHKAAAKLDWTTKQNVGPIYASDSQGRIRFQQADMYRITQVVDGQMAEVKRGNHRLGAEFGPKYKGLIKTGTARHTRYLTIRTITPDSKGWNIPARAGKHIAQQVGETAGPYLEPVIRAALMGEE